MLSGLFSSFLALYAFLLPLSVFAVRFLDPKSDTKSCILAHAKTLALRASNPAMIQIGVHLSFANNNDPFREVILDGTMAHTVMVEPQPHIAKKLHELILEHAPGRKVDILNRAVGDSDGEVVFYTIDAQVDPLTGCVPGSKKRRCSWMTTQVASMSKEHILKHARWVPDIEDYIVETKVRLSTVSTIVREMGISADKDLIILSVDAEGFDAQIISSIDFDQVRPWLVIFEYQHLKGTSALKSAEEYLMSFGYTCFRDVENFWCIGGRRDHPLFTMDSFCECKGLNCVAVPA